MSLGALARWQAEVRAGQRKATEYDPLFSAASAEKLGDEYGAMGIPIVAEHYYDDARRIMAKANLQGADSARSSSIGWPVAVRKAASW